MFFSRIVASTVGALVFARCATANATSEADPETDAVQQTNHLLRGGLRRELTALSHFEQGPDGWYSQPHFAGHAYCYNRVNDWGTDGFELEQCAQACIDCNLGSWEEGSCGPITDETGHRPPDAEGLSGCGSFMLNGGGRCFLFPPIIPDDCTHNNPFPGMSYYELQALPNPPTNPLLTAPIKPLPVRAPPTNPPTAPPTNPPTAPPTNPPTAPPTNPPTPWSQTCPLMHDISRWHQDSNWPQNYQGYFTPNDVEKWREDDGLWFRSESTDDIPVRICNHEDHTEVYRGVIKPPCCGLSISRTQPASTAWGGLSVIPDQGYYVVRDDCRC